ncbi:MAG: hypothetical protein FGM14_09115 [Flavobacteriales bacterium]|nr:hypothetical protein [Flavobacteriales bacterium]
MELTAALKKEFQVSLRNEKNSFYEETKKQFKEAQDNLIFYPFLFGRLSRIYPEMYQEKYARDIIDATFEDTKNPTLKEFLVFKLKKTKVFDNPETEDLNNLEYDRIIKNALKEFMIQKESLGFPKINSVPLFLDLIMNREEAEKFHIKYYGQVFNIEGWINHIKSLVPKCYEGFEFDAKKSTSGTFRFVKKINDDFHIGLEYNNNEILYQIKRNFLHLPDINIIIYNNEFRKSTKFFRFESKTVWGLGTIENPFFSLQTSLVAYYLRLTSNNNIDKTYSGRSIAFRDKIGENKYRIYNDSNFSEALNLFAFYEFFVSAKYNKSYINYLERSFKKCIE